MSSHRFLAGLLLASSSLLSQAHAQTAAAKPVDGGTLTVVSAEEPTSLVSFLDTKTDNRNVSGKITEGLLRYDAKFTPQGLLATAWSVSPDGLAYTFTLRPNVKWHDGQPFTSADVRYSILTQKKQGPRGRITLANVDRVDTPDPLTAIIVLNKPAPFLLKSLSSAELPIVPQHIYGDGDPLASKNIAAPIGTGPFMFQEWVRGSHVILKKNPNYWAAGKPHLDRVIFKFIRDPAAISAALETGEVDAARNVSLSDLERLGKNPRLKVDASDDAYLNNASFLEFNLDNPILAKPEVRHAIAHAIDREFIKKAIYYGRADVVNSPVPKVLGAYYDDSTFNYPYDTALANKLLDQAGYPRKNGGERFSLKLIYIPGADFRRQGEYMRSALNRLGIKVEILDGDLPTFLRHAYTAHDFDLNINGLGRLYDPTVGVQRIYWSDGIKNPLIWINASHYNNPAVDDLFRRAAVETNNDTRAAQFREIQQIVGRDLPALPLLTVPTALQVLNARVHNLYNSIDVTSGDFSDAWVESVN